LRDQKAAVVCPKVKRRIEIVVLTARRRAEAIPGIAAGRSG
jgi:hypothetical protein